MMPLIIGRLQVDSQTGGKFNFGAVFFTSDKMNIHLESSGSSFNQGNFNNQASFSNSPIMLISGISTDIADPDAFEKIF